MKDNQQYYKEKRYIRHFEEDTFYSYLMIIVWIFTWNQTDWERILTDLVHSNTKWVYHSKKIKYGERFLQMKELEEKRLTFSEMRKIYTKAVNEQTKDDAYPNGHPFRHKSRKQEMMFSDWVKMLDLGDRKFSKSTFYRLRSVYLQKGVLKQDGGYYYLNIEKALEAMIEYDTMRLECNRDNPDDIQSSNLGLTHRQMKKISKNLKVDVK